MARRGKSKPRPKSKPIRRMRRVVDCTTTIRQLGSAPGVHQAQAKAADRTTRRFLIQTNKYLRAGDCVSAARSIMEANAHAASAADERAHGGRTRDKALPLNRLVDEAFSRFRKACLR